MNKIKIPSSFNDTYELSNGVKIPVIGYGTWKTPSDITAESVKNAIEIGYRHIDTAAAYGNEEAVGMGIKASGIGRDNLFITTKHWVTERGYQKTLDALDSQLEKLGIDYLDLYLIHWPCVEASRSDWEEQNAETWRGFEKAYKDGKIRAIGVSNFEKKHMEALKRTAEILPMVNQIEFHPGYLQMENVIYSQENDMLVEAWSPLGSGAVLKDETLAEIAAKYNKSVAQLCIRFALECGTLPLVKSISAQHTAENAKVFDFAISDKDRETILKMPILGYSDLTAEEAPADKLAGLV